MRSTARSPITSLTAGFGAIVAREPETPGICGISDLKRSDGGWSVIWLSIDSILKEEKVDNRQLKVETEEQSQGDRIHNWPAQKVDDGAQARVGLKMSCGEGRATVPNRCGVKEFYDAGSCAARRAWELRPGVP